MGIKRSRPYEAQKFLNFWNIREIINISMINSQKTSVCREKTAVHALFFNNRPKGNFTQPPAGFHPLQRSGHADLPAQLLQIEDVQVAFVNFPQQGLLENVL